MTASKNTPAPRKRPTTPTKKTAAAAGAKTPEDFLATIRGHVPDFVYPTTFGEVRLPGYMPTGFLLDNASLSEGEVFTKLITENTDEDSLNIIRMLPQSDFEGVEGSLESLMTAWFGSQGVTTGESEASSD